MELLAKGEESFDTDYWYRKKRDFERAYMNGMWHMGKESLLKRKTTFQLVYNVTAPGL